MKQTDTEYVVIGKLGAPYGIKGWLKVFSFTHPVKNISTYPQWYIEDKGQWRPTVITGCREHGSGMIAKLKELNTPEQARLFSGKEIAISRSALPALKKHEYYWRDLEGLTVINQHQEELGKVIYLMETGSNDVLVVKGNKEHAIPYLPDDVITRIDLETKIIYVNWEEL